MYDVIAGVLAKVLSLEGALFPIASHKQHLSIQLQRS